MYGSFEIVSAAGADFLQELVEIRITCKVGGNVIASYWCTIDAKNLPKRIVFRSGNFDDMVASIVLPGFRQNIDPIPFP